VGDRISWWRFPFFGRSGGDRLLWRSALLDDRGLGREAEPLALRIFAIQDSSQDTLARLTAGQLAAIYDATGRKERAEQYRARVAP
jgi:hypothetical protein